MAILITGGAGYIGSHTSLELLNAGYDVIIFDNFRNSNPEVIDRIRKIAKRSFRFYHADLLEKEDLDKVFTDNKVDAVIHFAALKAVGKSISKPLSYYHNNLTGTLNLCESMSKHHVRKLIFSSSATVYGRENPSPLTEDMPTSATNPYGRTKLMNEQILRDVYDSDNSWSIVLLRYFNPIGAHASGGIGEDPTGIPDNLMPYIVQIAIGKRKILNIFGRDYNTKDGTGVRDYIHVMDVAKAHIVALEYVQHHKGVEVFNLGTGLGYSVLDIVKVFEKVNGVKIPFQFIGRRPGDVSVCYADPGKAASLLGWKAEKNIEEMCRDAWRWQISNPNGYR